MSELAVWKALVGGPEIQHAHATVKRTPEEAVTAAIARAEWKYAVGTLCGADQDRPVDASSEGSAAVTETLHKAHGG